MFSGFSTKNKFYEREKAENPQNFSQLNKKLTGPFKGRNGLREMQANVEKLEKERNLLKKTSAFSENGKGFN